MSKFGHPSWLLSLLCLGAAALLLHVPGADAQSEATAGASASSDTVQVASPTGNKETDRASILAALEQVRPGGTVQFAAGTYLIGPIIRVPTDEITLLGHPDGTVIRGCEPDAFPQTREAYFACHGFELSGARQTVRNLTFEYTWHGLFVGCCFPADREAVESGGAGPVRTQPGGHLIEGNHIIGAEGIGIEILHASGNRIANNTFTGIQRCEPFPGNTFDDIAGSAIVIEGDSNRVQLTDVADKVRDLGTGNRVSGQGSSTKDPKHDGRAMGITGLPSQFF